MISRQQAKDALVAIPAPITTLFAICVILMNLFANKSIDNLPSFVALDTGFTLSWVGSLICDIVVKRFGPKATITLSVYAFLCNMFAAVFCFIISIIPGTWSASFDFLPAATSNAALDETFRGTWFVLMGSSIAFLTSSVVDAVINWQIKKHMKDDSLKSYSIRALGSTFISQFIDNFVFAIIVSYNFFGWSLVQCITCSFIGMLFEFGCECLFNPLGYKIAKKWDSIGLGQKYLDKYADNL